MSLSSLSEKLVTRINSSLSDSMSRVSTFPRSDISSGMSRRTDKTCSTENFFEPLVSLQPAD